MKHFITFVAIGFAMVALASAEVTCPQQTDEMSIYMAHETECGKFYECSANVPILLECAPGTYFDTKLNVCNWNVDCGNLLTSTVPPPTTPAAAADEE